MNMHRAAVPGPPAHARRSEKGKWGGVKGKRVRKTDVLYHVTEKAFKEATRSNVEHQAPVRSRRPRSGTGENLCRPAWRGREREDGKT